MSLEILKKQRESVKQKLHLFEKYISNVKKSIADNQGSISDIKYIEIEQRIFRTDQYLNQFDQIQNEIECSSESDDIQAEYSERELFENRFHEGMSDAKAFLFSLARAIPIPGTTPVNSGVKQIHSEGVKLPTIQLPKFDGSYDQWMEFRDVFKSLIQSNTQISNIQKFHYLRASLTGGAAEVIKSMEFTDANYKVAWDMLCDRFENKRLLVQNHVKAIFNLKQITFESSMQLRNIKDELNKHLRSLEQLGEPVEKWDTLVIHIVTSKFDISTKKEWEKDRSNNDVPTLKELKSFLKNRADLLETIESPNDPQNKQVQKREHVKNVTRNLHGKNSTESPRQYVCAYCKREHSIYYCPEFLRLPVKERKIKIRNLQLCNNCLRSNHQVKDCRFSGCKYCSNKHNTLLHEEATVLHNAHVKTENRKLDTADRDDSSEFNTDSTSICTLAKRVTASSVLLSTASVFVGNDKGAEQTARVLLDSSSMSSFITIDLSNRLKLPKIKTNLAVSGFNNALSFVKHKCNLRVQSIHDSFSFEISCFVIESITGILPESNINKSSLDFPIEIQLADPSFHIPGKIDILIGSDYFWELLCNEQIKLGPSKPILQKTKLGWVVAGPIQVPLCRSNCSFSKNLDIETQLSKFWEVEEMGHKKALSSEEILCEQHFSNTVRRDENGRFVVSLPLKDTVEKLGESRHLAIKQFYRLEKRLQSNEKLKGLYSKFLNEYESLGHMSEDSDFGNGVEFYMPHHGVLRENSITTKLRVVFNASAPSTTGVSLNDLQMTGPIIQDDLLSIILRFRMHAIIITSDVKMMYRQVLIEPKQRNLQKIVWRSNPGDPLRTYKINRLVYGMTAASYLAIRCLHELADIREKSDLKISHIIKTDMYVDDLVTGADTPEEAKYICKRIDQILLTGGFELRKWRSNMRSVIDDFSDKIESEPLEFFPENIQQCKTLGLSWISETDKLQYVLNENDRKYKVTKRTILSRISTIFDPLGLLSACVIVAKIILQKLWEARLTWDEEIPRNIYEKWREFETELHNLNDLRINRKVVCHEYIDIELHGFSDSSQDAYGACVYVKSFNQNNEVEVNLLIAKSKVAPLSKLNIPRLELCAALLLARLVSKVVESLKVKFKNIYCWTDSTIVLGWLKTSPNLLKPFVDNRLAEIQRLTKSCIWKHVPTNDNPADLVSRGINPKYISNCHLWWHGPTWLLKKEPHWPYLTSSNENLPELRKVISTVSSSAQIFPFDRFSKLTKIKRSMAYIMRFLRNCRTMKENREIGKLTCSEIENAFLSLIKMSQREMFSFDYSRLKENKSLKRDSSLLSLNPFLDQNGLLRVGGRLAYSKFAYDKKHPLILGPKHDLTRLIFEHKHRELLHAGPQLILSNIRETFWPISGRNMSKKIVRSCIKCCKYTKQAIQPIMGNLPESRLEPSPPFSKVGVDYAGPFVIKDRKGRGAKISKAWVCVFVCFLTRAIHIDLVTALTAEAFIQVLRRFASRRGKPSDIFSDNGTNFVGASHELQTLGSFLIENSAHISEQALNININWHFIPANSPHFGGLWEAGVKSLKHHLRRVIGDLSLTYEDFQTLLTQIEAVLNSRPLSPLSSEPDDLTPLTPAHFLIGRSIQGVPDPLLYEVPENKLSHFQHLQKLQQHFWERWSREYIGELQQRSKWKQNQSELKVGQLVLVKETNLPVMKWRLGRVLELIPGRDGVCRVASVKTADGVLSRALTRLCPLPVGA